MPFLAGQENYEPLFLPDNLPIDMKRNMPSHSLGGLLPLYPAQQAAVQALAPMGFGGYLQSWNFPFCTVNAETHCQRIDIFLHALETLQRFSLQEIIFFPHKENPSL